MKKIQLMWIVVVLWFCWFLAWCSKNLDNDTVDSQEVVYDPSAEYNNNLTDIVNICNSNVSDVTDSYIKYEPWSSAGDIESLIINAISICEKSSDQINSLWSWEWDSSLKDAAIIFVNKVVEYLSLEKSTLPYLEKIDTLTQYEKLEHNAIVDELNIIEAELNQIVENLVLVQDDFVKKYDLEKVD